MLALNRDVAYIYEPLSRTDGLVGVPAPMLYVREGSRDEPLANTIVSDLLAGHGRFRVPERAGDSPARHAVRRMLKSKSYLRYRRDVLNPVRRRWLLKDPWACLSAEWLHRRFDAPTVVIVRHPVPTVLSYRRLGWPFPLDRFKAMDELMADHLEPVLGNVDVAALDPLENAALMWRLCNVVLGRYVDRNPDLIVVRHEDLSTEPIRVLRDLYGRLGLRFNARAERIITKHTGAGNQGAAVGDQLHQLRRNSAAVAAGWKSKVDPADAATIRRFAGPEADRWYSESDW
jgi:hypothetical protein